MDYTKQLEKRYPMEIVEYLRQRAGLEKDDNSMDRKFLHITSSKVFKEVLSWNGLLGGWDYTIKDWIQSIYGIDLDDLEKK